MARRVLVLSDRMGRGEEDLGRVLMRNFLYTLARNEKRPAAIMFANEGVRLACAGSDVLDDLRLLAASGVKITACGTCLDYLELTDSLEVGEIGTMPGAVAALMGDDDVITIA